MTPKFRRPLEGGPARNADVSPCRVVLSFVPVPAGPVREGPLADGALEPTLRGVDEPVPVEVRALQETPAAKFTNKVALLGIGVRRRVSAEVVEAGELPAADGAGVARPWRARIVRP